MRARQPRAEDCPPYHATQLRLRHSLSTTRFVASFGVRLLQKFQKIFTRDAAESLWEHACRWTHPVSSRRILGTINRAELKRLREHYPHRPNARKINAYEDADYWVGVNIKRVQDLWLDRSPPLHVLDLGCGPGYFLYLCQLFGHEGIGLDPDDEPFFRGTTEFFGVRRVVARINAQAPLPDLGRRFDLVTAHRVCFHRIARREDGEWLEWTETDWKFFINDVRTRLLKPGGQLLLEFNRRADGSSFFTPELRAFFESQGARIVRWKALLAADPNQRPRFKQIR